MNLREEEIVPLKAILVLNPSKIFSIQEKHKDKLKVNINSTYFFVFIPTAINKESGY